jgi:sialic acid synthase SpsE
VPQKRASLDLPTLALCGNDISEGTAISGAHVRSISLGCGSAPKYLPEVIGRRIARFISRGTPLDWTLVR